MSVSKMGDSFICLDVFDDEVESITRELRDIRTLRTLLSPLFGGSKCVRSRLSAVKILSPVLIFINCLKGLSCLKQNNPATVLSVTNTRFYSCGNP